MSNTNAAAGQQTWTQLSPSGGPPAIRGDHAAVYDPVHRVMIVFSGSNGAPTRGSLAP